MSDLNPYSAPASELEEQRPQDTGEAITTEMVQSLQRMGPWVRLLAVLLFLGTAFLGCGGFGALIGGVASLPARSAQPATMMVGLGLLYLLMGAIYLIPALQLNRAASAAKRAEPGLAAQPLEEALDNLYRFFRTVGILFLAMVGLYLVVIVVAIALGAAGMLNGAAG